MEKKKAGSKYIEGKYAIKHPLLSLVKPRIILSYSSKKKKMKGELRWLNKRTPLTLINHRQEHLVFQFKIDIFAIDMVLNFKNSKRFDGFFDMPLGHIRFTGRLIQKRRR